MDASRIPDSAAIADALLRRARECLLGVDEEPQLAHLHPVASERSGDHAPLVGPV